MSGTVLADIEVKLKERLTGLTFEHSLRTGETARQLSMRFGVDTESASMAAVLHDYAKDLSGLELLGLAKSMGIACHLVDEKIPLLLHAPVGAALVEAELGIEDPVILGAIAKHTYGDAIMSDLDRIVYLADLIEPGRRYPGIEKIRSLAETDLPGAFKAAYLYKIKYLLESGSLIHPVTVTVWNRLIGDEGNG